jgi:subtilisin-like proprotein convertase family protein
MHISKPLLCFTLLGISGSALAGGPPGFCNSSPITIADAATASVYPSAITVSGAPGNITGVTLTINGFSHDFPDDVGIVLVGPTGQALLLQSGAGDAAPVSNVSYSFDDAAAATLPDLAAWAGGSYKPTNYTGADNFPAPGPGTTYANPGPANTGTATLASAYAGTTSNGTWNLYVADFASGDDGAIAGGWCINFTGTPVSLQSFSVD